MNDYSAYSEKMKKLGPLPEDMRVFWVGSDIARIEARTTYTLECISRGIGITTSLDDMAQIIGYEAKLVEDTEKDIINGLMDNCAVLVKATAEARGGSDLRLEDGKLVGDEDGPLIVSEDGEIVSRRKEYSIWDRGYAVTTGRDPYEAYVALTILEKAAEVEIKAEAFGGTEPLTKSQARKLHKKYLKSYSLPGMERRNKSAKEAEEDHAAGFDGTAAAGFDGAAVGFDVDDVVRELSERTSLVEYGNKLVKSGLVQGTWGNISVRLNDVSMLVTPSGLDYDELKPEDMVKVGIEKLDWDKSGYAPTTEKLMHSEIYKARPEVGAIVHTHSKYCSVLAACRMPLEVHEETLMAQLGEVLAISDYADAGSHLLSKNVVDALGSRVGCIMSNHGMVACGKDLEEAFANAEAMEEAARRLINDRLARKIV